MDNLTQTTNSTAEPTQLTATPTIEPTPAPTPTPEPAQPSKELIDQIQAKSFGYAFGLMDNVMAELGYPKPDGVKTTDHIKSVLEQKSTKEGTKDVAPKVDETELGAKFKALQEQYKAKEAELESIKASTATAKRDFWVDSIINALPIETPDYLSDVEKSRMQSRAKFLIKEELTKNYQIKEEQGEFRFYQKDGTPILDGTIDMNPIKPSDLINREFSEFLAKPKSTPTPAGTGATQSKAQSTQSVIPSKVKTANEFYTYLNVEKKLIFGSKEFNEQLAKAKEERPAMFN